MAPGDLPQTIDTMRKKFGATAALPCLGEETNQPRHVE